MDEDRGRVNDVEALADDDLDSNNRLTRNAPRVQP